jgi:hypothetical protein
MKDDSMIRPGNGYPEQRPRRFNMDEHGPCYRCVNEESWMVCVPCNIYMVYIRSECDNNKLIGRIVRITYEALYRLRDKNGREDTCILDKGQ